MPVTSWSDTSITVTIPTGATSGNMVVTTSQGASNAVPFTVTSGPTFQLVSIASVPHAPTGPNAGNKAISLFCSTPWSPSVNLAPGGQVQVIGTGPGNYDGTYTIADVSPGPDDFGMTLVQGTNTGTGTVIETGSIVILAGMTPPGSSGILQLTTNGTSGLSIFDAPNGILNVPNYSAVPTGSTGILTVTTTAAKSATYNPSTGALNIPVYAPGGTTTSNSKKVDPTMVVGVGGNIGIGPGIPLGPRPTGIGFPFTAKHNPCVLLSFSVLIGIPAPNVIAPVIVYRTTGAMPSLGGNLNANDVAVFSSSSTVGTNVNFTVEGSFLDTTLTVGTAYNYYLTVNTPNNSQAWDAYGNVNIRSNTRTGLSAFEVK